MSNAIPASKNLSPGREDWIDYVRAIACLMVILLHSAANYVITIDIQTVDWAWANAIDSAARACVPLFFMVTGYLFLKDRAPRPRHLLRVLASIGVYSSLALIVVWIATDRFPLDRIVHILYQPVFYHLWYLYALLGIYLIGSIVNIRPSVSGTSVVVLCILMFILNDAGATPFGSVLALDGQSIIFFLLAVSGAVMGQLLPTLSSKRQALVRRASFIGFWLIIIAIAYLTQGASKAAGQFVKTYYSFSHPLVIGAAFTCFTWLHLAKPPRFIQSALQHISDHSLAIYGVHALVLFALRKITNFTQQPAVVEIVLIFTATFVLSYLIALLLRCGDPRKFFT
jgi:surface polysaccharide O-acyltransferase-like enzyme